MKKIVFFLLLITIILIRLPPIYLIPIKSAFVTSHSLVRYLILTMLVLISIDPNKKKHTIAGEKLEIILILFFFTSQSLSVIKAINISAFLTDYKTLIFSLPIFFVVRYLNLKKPTLSILMSTLLMVAVINIIYESILYFYPNSIYSLLAKFLYRPYWEFFDYQFLRKRFFIDSFDEVLIPFIFFFLIKMQNQLIKYALLLLGGAIVFFALASNWRIKLLMAIFSLIGSLIIYRPYLQNAIATSILGKTSRPKGILAVTLLIFFFFALIYLTSLDIVGLNALDRIISPNKEDLYTLLGRLSLWRHSINMAISSPLTGVGLGNFADYLPSTFKEISILTPFTKRRDFALIDNPHNVFFSIIAETGLLGLISFIILLAYFYKNDFQMLKMYHLSLVKSYIVAFWTLFIFSLLNPATQFPYFFLFWLLRGLIVKIQS